MRVRSEYLCQILMLLVYVKQSIRENQNEQEFQNNIIGKYNLQEVDSINI